MRFINQLRYYHLSLQEDYNENLLILIIHFYKHLQLLHFVILLHRSLRHELLRHPLCEPDDRRNLHDLLPILGPRP